MADRLSRSVLEFVTKGEEAVVGAYDKVERKAKQSGETVTVAGQRMGGSMQALTVAMKAFLALEITQRVTQIGAAVFASAGQIVDLAKRTRLTTDTIQEMQHVAGQTGTSLEVLSGSAVTLGENLANGTRKVRAAVAELGLSYAELRASSLDEQFRRVIPALEAVTNEQDRLRLGMVLLGPQFSEMAASLRAGYTSTAQAAQKSSKEQLEALDATRRAWKETMGDAMKVSESTAGAIVMYFREAWAAATLDRSKYSEAERSRISDALGSNQIGDLTKVLDDIAKARRTDIELTNTQTRDNRTFVATMTAARAELRALTAADKANLDAALTMGKGYEEIARTVNLSEEAFNLYKQEAQEATRKTQELQQAAARFVASIRYFNTADNLGTEFRNTMADTADEIREAVEQTRLLAYQTLPDAAAAAAALRREMESRGAVFPGTVPMYPPGTADQPSIWARLFGAGGDNNRWLQMLGSGLGLASGLIPGQSRFGSSLGSVVGGFFGPLGSALGGLAGGLIGKLFGGGQAGETRKARDAWIESVGGIDKLRDMATKAGVSLDKLFSTKKVKDFEAESKRVMAAIEAHQQKVAALQQEMADLEAERDRLTDETTVTHDMMRAQAEKFGINQEGLGRGFQQGRLNASAAEIIEALEIFKRGDANMGTVLFGMRDEISALVRESAKFGTEIPANLQPFIEHLFETGNLLDENGEALKELPTIKFGDAMASQLEKASDRLAEVVDKIADILSQLGKLDGKEIDFTVTGDYRERGEPGVGTYEGVWRDAAAGIQSVMGGLPSIRPSGGAAAVALGSSSTPLAITLDGQVVAKAVIQRTGRTLALVGA